MAGLIAIGILVRLRIYFADLSLWRDEAALALNIIHKSFVQLLGPLDYDQGAPVGFLMIQKLVVTLRGGGEMALRLWPVTASILAIPIFFAVCYRVVGAGGDYCPGVFRADGRSNGLLGGQQAILHRLSCDGRFAPDGGAALTAPDDFLSVRRLRWLAIAGALVIWFSHPSIFVLAGIFVALSIRRFGQRIPQNPWGLFLLLGAWGASFLLEYFLCLSKLTKSSYLQHYWSTVGAAICAGAEEHGGDHLVQTIVPGNVQQFLD